jgi:hypothetical protein
MSRFSETDLQSADGVAALALVRAFVAYLHDTRGLSIEEVAEIQNAAIEDLSSMSSEVYEEARVARSPDCRYLPSLCLDLATASRNIGRGRG